VFSPRELVLADVPYGKDPAQTVDVFAPTELGQETTILINLHGGGWYTGDKSLATGCCAQLARRGLVVVNANYRIRTDDPAPLMVNDALSVLEWLGSSTNSPSFVAAAARNGVTLAGDSAGAHIAALASAATLDPSLAELLEVGELAALAAGGISALIAWSGALGLSELLVDKAHPEYERFTGYISTLTGRRAATAAAARIAELDPVTWINERMPPTLVFTSALDFFHDSTIAFTTVARRAHCPITEVVFDASHLQCSHSWQLDSSLCESQTTYDSSAEFAKRVR
jgi:acetyl esterase/lipase